jgi:1,4-dihydroxy-2-naphthoyl-CoA hydrolase
MQNSHPEPRPVTHYEGALVFDIVHDTAEETVAHMPVTPAMHNPFGTVHAGALIWFADVTATTLALQGKPVAPGMSGFPLAINLAAQLLGNCREGVLVATARFVKRGRTLSVVRTAVTSPDGTLLIEVTTSHLMSR